jgi:hydroxymethylpyrimidine pyrophosphatase-like HAD family hydrolase
MRFRALATDYDDTLAERGVVRDEVVAALERVRASGRRLVLVTGRLLPDLRRVFPRVDVFDAVVAENGGVLLAAGEERLLGPPASPELLARLAARGVPSVRAGRVVVSTLEPHQRELLEEIERLGLPLEVTFNKGAVMALPRGVDKGSGLTAALAALGLSPRDAVAAGDAENDEPLLAAAGRGVAVANALPALKRAADLVLEGAAGDGVIELAARLLADDVR